MNAQHTPGPWTVVNDPDQPGLAHIESASQTIACEVDDENAALIAAAPAMLAALLEVKRLRDLWRSQEDDSIDSVAYMDGLDRLDVDRIVALARGS